MRTLSPRTPPPSSYSHAPHHTPNITAHEISSRIGLPLPEESCFGPHSLPYISLLPPEILAEIFLLCIPDSQFPLPYNNEAPISLSHVSSMWRALALSTPDLWTGLHLNYKDPAEDVPAAEMWLSRSGDKSLSLSIAIDFSEQPQQEIIDVLCKHSSRWKHVRFEFRNLFCPPMYSLDMAMGDIGELRTFEFHARDISTINVEPITNLLASAPNLRQVTWVDDLADTDTLLQLPLNRLTHLSLSMDHGTLDREVLGACYNLEHIRLTRPFSLTSHSQEPLLLPKLSSINISSGIAGVLDHLVLPALRDVRIHGDNDHRDRALPLGHDAHSHLSGSWDPTPLLSLVGRSACSITSLSVGPPMTEAALMICLRGTGASLVTLRVQGVPVGDTLLEALTCRSSQLEDTARARAVGPSATITTPEGGNTTQDADGGMPLCPHLEELVLDTRVGCSSGVLAAMVESRLNRPGSQTTTAPPQSPEYTSSTEPFRISSLLSIEVIDGHKDLQRLKMLSAPASRSQRLADEDRDGRLALHIIPRKAASPNTRNYLFRRKLCASR